MEFGRWSYISRLSWTVLASILEGLGVDFAPLGVHLGSNLAPKSDPEPPKTAQETSKSAQEPPKTDQEPPTTAQEPPKTAQELPKSRPRCPGAAQDLTRSRPGPPRSALDPTPYPRLEKNLPTSPRNPSELLSEPQSGQKQKQAAAVLPPRGSSIRRPSAGGVLDSAYEVF